MKGLLLISGGFDSPVAGYLMKKKMDLEAVHFSNALFASDETVGKARKLCEILGIKDLHVIDLSEKLLEISKNCGKYYFVVMKRLFLKEAERIAKERGCDYLITGDSLAQVSSQTLENLAVVDKATELVVLRPLISWDKMDIVEFSKKIGTHNTSVGPEHCDALGPDKVSTMAKMDDVLEVEKKLSFKL